jgi:hypothetical protein
MHAHEHDRPPRSLPAAPATHRPEGGERQISGCVAAPATHSAGSTADQWHGGLRNAALSRAYEEWQGAEAWMC